jgi:hypothetical protein
MQGLFRQAIMSLFLAVCFLLSTFLSGDEFSYKPPQGFKLNPKYIGVQHPVRTKSDMAQLYFNQGLSFIYAFNHEAAYWSFLRASEADPNMAMAYWGMGLSLGMTINTSITPERSKRAYGFANKALQLSSNGPENEKAYAKALITRYSEDPKADKKKLNEDYSHAMEEFVKSYPDDLDAAVLYAESLLDLHPWNQWSLEGSPLPGTKEAVETLQSVLKRDPDHLGANHYFIHAVEASPNPEIALMSAERLKTLNAGLGHIIHMPSHIYMRVGEYHEAARSTEEAIAADHSYMRNYGISENHPSHSLIHNYCYLARAYALEGRFEEAKKAADDLVNITALHKQMPDLEVYASAPLSVLITFHRWNLLLEMPQPPEELPINRLLWRFGRALAFAKLGELAKAQEEQRLFQERKSKLPPEIIFGNNKGQKIAIVADFVLKAQLAEAQGDFSQAVAFLQQAVKEQDTLLYNEPPDWFFSTRLSLGGLLLRMKRAAEAEAVFREDLNRNPRNGRALFGLRESLKDQSKWDGYYWINEEFQKAWKYSDGSGIKL